MCLILREDPSYDILSNHSNGVCEVLAVKVHQLDTVVLVLYRPPDTVIGEFAPILRILETTLDNLPSPVPNITLMGDLNFPSSYWDSIEGVLIPKVFGHRMSQQHSTGRKA